MHNHPAIFKVTSLSLKMLRWSKRECMEYQPRLPLHKAYLNLAQEKADKQTQQGGKSEK